MARVTYIINVFPIHMYAYNHIMPCVYVHI